MTEKVTRTSFVTLHLSNGKVFDGVIIADFGGAIQLMPKECSKNFNLPKDELDVLGMEEGELLPRYIMKMEKPTGNPLAQDMFDRFAA